MDTDKLIQLVQQQPVLWDKGNILFKDKLERDKAWCLVAEELFENMGNEEKQEKITAIKCKWKNVRDCYTKFTNQGKSGDPATKKKKYLYADVLSFLSNSMENISTSGKMDGSASTANKSNDDSPWDEKEGMEGDANGTMSQDTNNARASTSRPKLSRKPEKLTIFQKRLLEQLEKRAASQPEDPDKSFLMSVLPDMRKLDDAAKSDFKIYVLKYFSPPSPIAPTFDHPPPPSPNPDNQTD